MPLTSSSLCKACGLCCNGVLFYRVRLQLTDSPQQLKMLGLRIQHKKKADFFDQPCRLLKENCCSIYEQRPERCQIFECQRLKLFKSGERTEASVLLVIEEAKKQVQFIRKLLQDSGKVDPKEATRKTV